jgi:hypothetical protein
MRFQFRRLQSTTIAGGGFDLGNSIIYHSVGELPSFFVKLFKQILSVKYPRLSVAEQLHHLITLVDNLKICLLVPSVRQIENIEIKLKGFYMYIYTCIKTYLSQFFVSLNFISFII